MKRIIALFMAAMMVIMMMPAAKAQAASENVTMTVTADKSVAMRGDTVNFSVAIGAVESLGGMCFKLVIPAGMTIVDSSITIPEGVKETLTELAKNYRLFIVSNSQKGYPEITMQKIGVEHLFSGQYNY